MWLIRKREKYLGIAKITLFAMTLIGLLGFSGLLNAQRLESFGRGLQPHGDDNLVYDSARQIKIWRLRV